MDQSISNCFRFIEMAKYLLANNCGGSEPDKEAELFLFSKRFSFKGPFGKLFWPAKSKGGKMKILTCCNVLTMQLQ